MRIRQWGKDHIIFLREDGGDRKKRRKKNTHHDTMNSWAQMGISSLISRERTFPCDDLPPGWGGAIFIYAYIKVYIGNATSHSLFTYPHDCQGSLARYKGHAYNNNRGKKERQRQADMFFFLPFSSSFLSPTFPPIDVRDDRQWKIHYTHVLSLLYDSGYDKLSITGFIRPFSFRRPCVKMCPSGPVT